MPKTKDTLSNTYPEIDHLREDLDSLKTNVIELTKNIKKNGSAQTAELKQMAAARLEELRESGRQQFRTLERRVKAKPAQALAIAFAAGLVASLLIGRR